jgi:acyl-CoA synthetase (AMP-forming)/AMP-acid ligase II/thioesterase domain-containing protein/aryl carrier-like protein
MAPMSILHLLEDAALRRSCAAAVTFYSHNGRQEKALTYAEFLQACQEKARLVCQIPGISQSSVVLLHFDSHEQNILWFWAVLLARCLPAISTPFTNHAAQHQKHLKHLKHLLRNPIVLTEERLVEQFDGDTKFNIQTVEKLQNTTSPSVSPSGNSEDQAGLSLMPISGNTDKVETSVHHTGLAVLMMTSGSTGKAKAVALRHSQIIAAIQGKARTCRTTQNDIFLNWVGLDHVAALVEMHLHSIFLGALQVHIQAVELIQNPNVFLETINRYRVSVSFAPNFLLANLERALRDGQLDFPGRKPDLSCLRVVTSGGEGNSISTAVRLLDHLQKYGAPVNVLVPGFGMTETCAGCIHNTRFPDYDLSKRLEFASLGHCNEGVCMRIRKEDGAIALSGEIGSLELSGKILFEQYYNDPGATASAHTSDGWFITGDLAFLDPAGNLNLAGRAKEVININGVKHGADDIDAALEDAAIAGMQPTYTKVSGFRPKGHATEAILVVYAPTFGWLDDEMRFQTAMAITKTVQIQCGSRPTKIIPLPRDLLAKSSLGKLSRAKIRSSFEKGEYTKYEIQNEIALDRYKVMTFKQPRGDLQETIRDVLAEVVDMDPSEIGANSGLMDVGVSSIEIFQFKERLQTRLKLDRIPIITILTNPTIEGLATTLSKLSKPGPFNPVVILRQHGTKAPLWLIHPGAGEVMIFLNLAKYMVDRPLYALRAKGFDGEAFFQTLDEAISTHLSHIKRMQPEGPYLILGYSFGGILAFEISKRLVREGHEVKFTGVLNLPPHIKHDMRKFTPISSLLTLSLFLRLIDDDDPATFHPDISKMDRLQVFDEVLRRGSPGRLEELGLDQESFLRWADLAFSLHRLAVDYEPGGMLSNLDIFVADPLRGVARNREEYFSQQLMQWQDYSMSRVRFHQADGEHFTMINEQNIQSFQKKLKVALQARGV